MEISIDIFAGLGLFFVGVKLIGSNLKQLTGRWFRRLIGAATRNPVSAALIGMLSGALTQSSSAITFISIGMVTAGLVGVAQVAPMVIWANVGTSALVILSAIEINLFVLFLIGATGVAYYFDVDKAPRVRHLLGSVLGLGLLFLGLELIKAGAAPLKSIVEVREFLAFAASSYVLAFLVGLVLAVIAQSSATVTIVAVTMTNIGILTLDQTIAIVFGASVGSGVGTGLLGANLNGVSRQLAYLQVVVKAAGVVLVLPFFIAETLGLAPGVRALVSAIAADAATQVALVYLLLQLVSAVFSSLFQPSLLKLMARLSPPTTEEVLSKPHFLYAEAIEEPRSALELVEREQMRLFGQLTGIVDSVREDGETHAKPAVLFAASSAIAARCDEFLAEILDNNSARDVLMDGIDLQKRNEMLTGLIGTANDYVVAVEQAGKRQRGDRLGDLLFALGESMHTILMVAHDALVSRDRADLDLLRELTSDRSAQMENIRRRIMGLDHITPADHDTLYATTTLFERTLWLIRRYATLVERSVPMEAAE
jgi:phosphate:Na+ symporter